MSCRTNGQERSLAYDRLLLTSGSKFTGRPFRVWWSTLSLPIALRMPSNSTST